LPQKPGDLEDPGASVAQVRAHFDRLMCGLLGSAGRQSCLLVNSAMENAAVDDVAAVVRGRKARLDRCLTETLRTRDLARRDPGAGSSGSTGERPGRDQAGPDRRRRGQPGRGGGAGDRR